MKKYIPYIVMLCLVGLCWSIGLASKLFNLISEARFEVVERAASGEIVLVAIDAKSIKKLEKWPWPRRYHAEIINKLKQAGASEIALDIDFSSRSNPEDDAALPDHHHHRCGTARLAGW